MRGALAVARLELREWRVVPFVALAVAAFVLVIDLLLRGWLWTSIAVQGFWALLAVLAGASVLARDLREERAAFLFARPLSLVSIWLGKLAAALVVASSAALPGIVLLARHQELEAAIVPAVLVSWLGSTVHLVGLGQWAGLALGGRVGRVVMDAMITLSLFGALSWLALQLRFAGSSQWSVTDPPLLWMAALLLAGLIALRRGRGDRARSYAAFAPTQWIALALCVLALWGALYRLRAVRASTMREALIEGVSPDGEWLRIYGVVPGRKASPSFLVSVAGEGFVNMGRGAFWESAAGHAFSADGQTCAWSVLETGGAGVAVRVKGRGTYVGSLPVTMHSDEADAVPGIALSPTGGKMLLAVGRGRIEVVEFDPGWLALNEPNAFRPLWSTTGVVEGGFLDDETVWLLRQGNDGRELVRADARNGNVRSVIALGRGADTRLRISPDGARALALARRGAGWAVELCDLHAGGCRVVWDGLPPDLVRGDAAEGAFLSDGSVVVAARLAAGAERSINLAPHEAVAEVRAFAADGTPRWTLPTALSMHAPILAGEPRPGLLFVMAPTFPRADPSQAPDPMLLVVDAASGRVEREEDGLRPSRLDLRWSEAGFGRGRAATYFRTAAGGIVRIDPETWRRAPIDFR